MQEPDTTPVPREYGQETINEFVTAAHFDLDKVQTLLAEHPTLLNENADWIETAIQAAAHVNNREIAEYLLAQGAPLDICTAAVLGRVEDVEAILAADPAAVQHMGAHRIPLLFFPVLAGRLDLVERLYAAGAQVNVEDAGQTPLHAAVLTGNLAIAQWLLDHDANPYAADFSGALPIDLAEKRGDPAMIELLRPYTDLPGEGEPT
jgi:ankyrin repeat protein